MNNRKFVYIAIVNFICALVLTKINIQYEQYHWLKYLVTALMLLFFLMAIVVSIRCVIYVWKNRDLYRPEELAFLLTMALIFNVVFGYFFLVYSKIKRMGNSEAE